MDFRYDAQSAFSFVTNQISYIEQTVYQIRYPNIRYTDLIPIDTSAGEWTPSVTYFSMDGVGRADWFNARAQDVPHAEVQRTKFETTVSMGAIGYGYDAEEVGQAMMLGRSITNDKASVARRVAEEFIDNVALFGDTTKSFKGLVNNSTVTASTAAATGTASGTTFASKTATNILADINAILLAPFSVSNGLELADTLLLPLTQWGLIATTILNTTTGETILDYVKRGNVYTAMTGQPVTIKAIWGLETAGSGATARMVAYRRDPAVVKLHMPMPHRFFPVYQVGPLLFEVPGVMRLGGTDIRLPSAVRYVDGI
jgi:hypothetical protein